MNKYIERIYNGIIKENPTFVLMLGMCPTLAVTTSAINGAGMGLASLVVLALSNLMISLLRNFIPDRVRMPAYIVVVASFVTMVQFLMQAYLPALNESLGIYIPLIVVNCIILGRAESYASKNTPILSLFDGIGMGLGFTIALTLLGMFREVLGAGSFAGFEIPFMDYFKIPILTQAPGGYLVFGILIAFMNKLTAKQGGVKKKSFSCDGCPTAHLCNKSGACLNSESKEENANV